MSEPAAAQAVAAPKSSDAARAYAHMIWQYRNGETVAAMIFVGDQLGLFKAMAGAGPLSADALAAKTGLHPRWLLEWMRLHAAGRVLYYRGDDRFELPAEAHDVLVDSDNAGFAASSFLGGHSPEGRPEGPRADHGRDSALLRGRPVRGRQAGGRGGLAQSLSRRRQAHGPDR